MRAFVGAGFGEACGHRADSAVTKAASIADGRVPEAGARPSLQRDSEVLLQAEVQAAARAELRRAHAHTGAVPQLIGAVQRVDQRQLGVQLAETVGYEVVRDVEVELE